MLRSLHFTPFIIVSFGLHLLLVAAAVFIANRADLSLPMLTPVDIINLPQNVTAKLPPVDTRPLPPPSAPSPRQIPFPERAPRPDSLPGQKHLGSSPDIALPRTRPPQGLTDGSDKGTSPTGKPAEGSHEAGKGPLPFLSQSDIDELARKGMPEKSLGDDSVTLNTDEFKFISYNRWLKYKVERVLKYPELAAISGLQGTLYIQFDIMKDGALKDLQLIKSSGYKILDDEALRSIRDAAPFQALPEEWSMDHYTIRAAVLFYLNEAYIR